MADVIKYSSKMDRELLDALRALADAEGRTLASVLGEAAREYLERAYVRPRVESAIDQVMREDAELLARLAR